MLVPSDLRQPGGSEGGNPGLEDVEDAIKRMNERKRGRRGEMDMILDPQRDRLYRMQGIDSEQGDLDYIINEITFIYFLDSETKK